MAYKYDVVRGRLRPTTPQSAYGLQSLKPPLPLSTEPSKIVWAVDPTYSVAAEKAKRIRQIRAVLKSNDALLMHLKGGMDRFIYRPSMVFVGIATAVAGYKLYRLAFKM